MLLAPPVIDVHRAIHVQVHSLAPIAFHNMPKARKVSLACRTLSDDVLACTLRVYGARRGAHHRRALYLKLPILTMGYRVKHATTQVFEDYSGFVRYGPGVELQLSPQDTH